MWCDVTLTLAEFHLVNDGDPNRDIYCERSISSLYTVCTHRDGLRQKRSPSTLLVHIYSNILSCLVSQLKGEVWEVLRADVRGGMNSGAFVRDDVMFPSTHSVNNWRFLRVYCERRESRRLKRRESWAWLWWEMSREKYFHRIRNRSEVRLVCVCERFRFHSLL